MKIFSRVGLNASFEDFLHTVQEMKFSIKDFLSKCDQIRWKLRIWSHLLRKFLMENFILCAGACISCLNKTVDSISKN